MVGEEQVKEVQNFQYYGNVESDMEVKDLMATGRGWFSAMRVAQNRGRWRNLVALYKDPCRTS